MRATGYIMILLKAMGFQTVYIGFYIFCIIMTVLFLQTELCSNWYYSKQTVNSSISAMTKKGWIMLETVPKTRNRKNIVLTEAGRIFCAKVIGETYEVEKAAFSRITEEERELFLLLFRKTNKYMREEYEKRYSSS